MPAMSSTADTTNRSLVPRRSVVTAAAEALKRRDQVPQPRLLALRGVPPDQRQAGHADDLRPAVDLDRAVVQHAGQQQEHGQQGCHADREGHALRVVPGLGGDAGFRALGRDYQPADEVDRHRPARRDQRGDNAGDPHGRGAEAAPRPDAGRDPAGDAVLRITAERVAVAVAPPPEVRPPVAPVFPVRAVLKGLLVLPRVPVVPMLSGMAAARPVLEPERRPRRFARFLHATIITRKRPSAVSGPSPTSAPAASGSGGRGSGSGQG